MNPWLQVVFGEGFGCKWFAIRWEGAQNQTNQEGDQKEVHFSKKREKNKEWWKLLLHNQREHLIVVHVPQIKRCEDKWRSAICFKNNRVPASFWLVRHHSKTTLMSILFGCVVKHVWMYRTSPLHLYMAKVWLRTAGLDQWVKIKPPSMTNIRTERDSRSILRGWNSVRKDETDSSENKFKTKPQHHKINGIQDLSCLPWGSVISRVEENVFRQHLWKKSTEKALVPHKYEAKLGVL